MASGRHAIASLLLFVLCLLPTRSSTRAADVGGRRSDRSVSSASLRPRSTSPWTGKALSSSSNPAPGPLRSSPRAGSSFGRYRGRGLEGSVGDRHRAVGSIFWPTAPPERFSNWTFPARSVECTRQGNARLTGVSVYGEAVYCVDNRNHRIVVFRKPGAPPRIMGKTWRGARPVPLPFRIAIDPSGRLFVTDVMNARVQWFSAFGKHLGTLKRFGAGEGKIFRPTGIALDLRGRLWVGDSYTGLVQLFEERGEFARALRARGVRRIRRSRRIVPWRRTGFGSRTRGRTA